MVATEIVHIHAALTRVQQGVDIVIEQDHLPLAVLKRRRQLVE